MAQKENNNLFNDAKVLSNLKELACQQGLSSCINIYKADKCDTSQIWQVRKN